MAEVHILAPGNNIMISSDAHCVVTAQSPYTQLADTCTLYLNLHNFYLNVMDSTLNTLHAMLMAQSSELWAIADPIAMYIGSLSHASLGMHVQCAVLASVPDLPAQPPKALEVFPGFVKCHKSVSPTACSLFERVSQAGVEGTADLLAQRLVIQLKTAWMLSDL